MPFLEEAQAKVKQVWDAMDKKNKVIIYILVGTLFFSTVIFAVLAGRVSYVPLYTNLDAKDSHQVVEHLDAQGVDYRIEGDGTSIMVDRRHVHRIRLQLAGEGVPQGGVVGFEIFDSTRLGTTEFERMINFYRALSGELSRTIMELDSVEMARVQITAPRQRLFVQDEEPMEATVLLKVSPLRRLDSHQVRSITHLVAGSVEGLTPDKVVVVDTDGNLLSEGFMQADSSFQVQEATRTNLEMQRYFEQQLQHDLERMLMPVLGINNFVVNVNALLNFDLREEQSRIYEPVVGERGIIRSQQIVEESYTGTPLEPEGVPGTDPNIPLYEAFGVAQEVEKDLYESITNYEINERIVSHTYAPGTVEKISVGVIINRQLTPEQLEHVHDAVAAAIGYEAGRGDQLYVSQLAFDETLSEEMAMWEAQHEAARQRQLYMYLGAILAVSFLLLLIIRRIASIARRDDSELLMAHEEPEEEERPEEELTPEEKEWRKIKKEITRLTTERPQETASLLKAWLTED